MRSTDFLASILLFSAASSAWPSGWDIKALQNDFVAPLLKRQDQSTSFDLSFSATQGNTATTETSSATSTGNSNSGSQTTGTGSQTGTATGSASGSQQTTGTASPTGDSQSGNKTSEGTKTFDARLPAGGVSMITPNVMTSSYFKINNFVTFAWNYTSLSVTPSAVDVLASCSLNQETYTIALNQSITGPTQEVIWDTGKYQATASVPLLTETYTLIIYDAAKNPSTRPQAGYLGTYDQFTFGMYSPQPYTPIAEWQCATCNSALSLAEKQTLVGMFAMAGLTVLSFGWFAGVAGLW